MSWPDARRLAVGAQRDMACIFAHIFSCLGVALHRVVWDLSQVARSLPIKCAGSQLGSSRPGLLVLGICDPDPCSLLPGRVDGNNGDVAPVALAMAVGLAMVSLVAGAPGLATYYTPSYTRAYI